MFTRRYNSSPRPNWKKYDAVGRTALLAGAVRVGGIRIDGRRNDRNRCCGRRLELVARSRPYVSFIRKTVRSDARFRLTFRLRLLENYRKICAKYCANKARFAIGTRYYSEYVRVFIFAISVYGRNKKSFKKNIKQHESVRRFVRLYERYKETILLFTSRIMTW